MTRHNNYGASNGQFMASALCRIPESILKTTRFPISVGEDWVREWEGACTSDGPGVEISVF